MSELKMLTILLKLREMLWPPHLVNIETEAKSVKLLAQEHIALLRNRTKTTTQDAKCSFLKTTQKYIPNPIVVALFHVGLPKLKPQSLF